MDFSREAKDIDSTQKLNNIKNYIAWAVQMRAILRKKKCYATIERSNALLMLLPALEVPEGLSDQARKSTITAKQEQKAANEEIQEKIDIILE